MAETFYPNILAVAMPVWSEADQQPARATQKLLYAPKKDLEGKEIDDSKSKVDSRRGSVAFSWGRGSGDIGDISWNIPTVVLRYPANFRGTQGHHWGDAIAMATPIAHKGTLVGAKATALTLIDMFTDPKILADTKKYFTNVQTKDVQYKSFLANDTPAATYINKEIQEKYRADIRKYYFNPSKYGTYLEQLGLVYPTLEKK